jgi:hypothetical protein
VDERIILRTMNEGEMSRRLPVNPLLSRHFEGIILRWSGRGRDANIVVLTFQRSERKKNTWWGNSRMMKFLAPHQCSINKQLSCLSTNLKYSTCV